MNDRWCGWNWSFLRSNQCVGYELEARDIIKWPVGKVTSIQRMWFSAHENPLWAWLQVTSQRKDLSREVALSWSRSGDEVKLSLLARAEKMVGRKCYSGSYCIVMINCPAHPFPLASQIPCSWVYSWSDDVPLGHSINRAHLKMGSESFFGSASPSMDLGDSGLGSGEKTLRDSRLRDCVLLGTLILSLSLSLSRMLRSILWVRAIISSKSSGMSKTINWYLMQGDNSYKRASIKADLFHPLSVLGYGTQYNNPVFFFPFFSYLT